MFKLVIYCIFFAIFFSNLNCNPLPTTPKIEEKNDTEKISSISTKSKSNDHLLLPSNSVSNANIISTIDTNQLNNASIEPTSDLTNTSLNAEKDTGKKSKNLLISTQVEKNSLVTQASDSKNKDSLPDITSSVNLLLSNDTKTLDEYKNINITDQLENKYDIKATLSALNQSDDDTKEDEYENSNKENLKEIDDKPVIPINKTLTELPYSFPKNNKPIQTNIKENDLSSNVDNDQKVDLNKDNFDISQIPSRITSSLNSPFSTIEELSDSALLTVKQIKTDHDNDIEEKDDLLYAFHESHDTHFLLYFSLVVIGIITCYVIFHNKQKIMAIIIEGRHQRRRRSRGGVSYRKLEVN